MPCVIEPVLRTSFEDKRKPNDQNQRAEKQFIPARL